MSFKVVGNNLPRHARLTPEQAWNKHISSNHPMKRVTFPRGKCGKVENLMPVAMMQISAVVGIPEHYLYAL